MIDKIERFIYLTVLFLFYSMLLFNISRSYERKDFEFTVENCLIKTSDNQLQVLKKYDCYEYFYSLAYDLNYAINEDISFQSVKKCLTYVNNNRYEIVATDACLDYFYNLENY